MFHRIFFSAVTLSLIFAETSVSQELIPSKVIPGNEIPKGTELTMFADHDEHEVIAPTALAFGENGDLYLVETHRFGTGVIDARSHRYWFLDDLAAETTADRLALHKKWQEKVSLEQLTKDSELIRRFVDKNGDGRADEVSVFADGFDGILDGTGAGIFVYEGKVYFACIPKLHILEDSNGDGVADKRESVADGFGVKIWFSGHDLNGFALGPDGRIYATIGDRGLSLTTREGKRYHMPNKGAVMRFEPDGSDLEIIHTGLRNPKEIAFDEWGNGFTVDNNSDQGDLCRLVYVMEGVDSGWRAEHQALFSFRTEIGLEENPISMWMTEQMSLVRNDQQPAHFVPPVANFTNGPSGLTYHPGTGFLSSEKGRFLICDYRGTQTSSGIWSFRVVADGAGMKLEDSRQFNWGVAATDVEYSYDGRLFVLDFVGGWVGGKPGRVYSLTATSEENAGLTPDVARIVEDGFRQRSNSELFELMSHADQRIRLRAHLALAGKDDGTGSLVKALESEEILSRLHGLWGLGIRARKDADPAATDALIGLLGDQESEVRAQAVKCLGEVSEIDAKVLLPLLADKSTRVRSFAAIALGRHKLEEAGDALLKLVEENSDKDLYLRHAAVMGLLGTVDAERLSKLSSHSSASVRMAAVIVLRRLSSSHLEKFLDDTDPKISDEAIRAIHEMPVEASRPAVAAILDGYLDGKSARKLPPMVARRAIHSAFRVGGMENAERLLKIAAVDAFDLRERREAMRLLMQWATPHPVDQSLGRWDPMEERDIDEIRSLLEAWIPKLLAAEKDIAEDALGLFDRHELDPNALPSETLEGIATGIDYPSGARTLALGIWVSRNPSNADEVLISLSNDAQDEVSSFVLAELVKLDPAKAANGLANALQSDRVARRQSAWAVAAKVEGEAAAKLIIDALEKLTSGEGDMASKLEIVEAAKSRGEDAVKQALAALESSGEGDPLAPWLAALEGGDVERGEELFKNHGTGQCLRCHRVGESDENIVLAGPNLSGLGAIHDGRYMLESLMLPGAEIAPGYGIISLTLNNGKSIGGIMLADETEHYDITVGEDHWRVKKSDVKSASEVMSSMPPMSAILDMRETRDLVAYLVSLKQPLKNAPKAPEPKLLDPAGL